MRSWLNSTGAVPQRRRVKMDVLNWMLIKAESFLVSKFEPIKLFEWFPECERQAEKKNIVQWWGPCSLCFQCRPQRASLMFSNSHFLQITQLQSEGQTESRDGGGWIRTSLRGGGRAGGSRRPSISSPGSRSGMVPCWHFCSVWGSSRCCQFTCFLSSFEVNYQLF